MTYRVVEVRKYLEGLAQGSSFEFRGMVFGSRFDAHGFSAIRMYQIGTDSRTGLEYIVISTRIIEEEAA